MTFPVTDKATGAPLTSGTLPKTAKGKTLKVNLTIRVGSKSVHRVATFTIR
ncbi:MAG: hypothetical protein ABUS54_02310 [Actinomycetota bacterium]